MADHNALRLSATLVLIGAVISTVFALFFHPGGGTTLQATFAMDAASPNWAFVHLGQFVGMAVLLAGLLVLYVALNVSEGSPHWLGFFGAVAAGVALALAGVLYAIDGVANKQAVDAWVSAPAAEKPTRFATAQALRWLETGTASNQTITVGLALVLLAFALVLSARVPTPIGYLMGVSGLAWLVLGWFVGTKGFTSANTLPSDVGYIVLFAAMIWLLIIAWPRKESA